MERIEVKLVMPRGPYVRPLASYNRYYAFMRSDRRRSGSDGSRRVIARFISGGSTRRWVAENALPEWFDGGCGVITIVFNLDSDRIEETVCNGVA